MSEETHKTYPGVVRDNGTNIGTAAAKATIEDGRPFMMERRPSGGADRIGSLSMMERKPSFNRSSRSSSRRGSGSIITPAGQQVAFHTRNQVSDSLRAEDRRAWVA